MCFQGSAADYALSVAKVVLSGSAARLTRGGCSNRQLPNAVGKREEGKKGEKYSNPKRRRRESTKERKT